LAATSTQGQRTRSAAWSLGWFSLALAFNGGLWWYLNGSVGPEIAEQKSLEFLSGYLIEKALSVDTSSSSC
jgi:tellurite resistance protein TerC